MKMVNQSRFGEQCWGRVEWPQHAAGYCTVPAHADLMAGMDKRWRAFIGDELVAGELQRWRKIDPYRRKVREWISLSLERCLRASVMVCWI